MKNTRPVAAISVLSLSHMLNDLYSNYLPQMLPFLVVLIPGFTVTQAAVLVAIFTITSSFAQPFFGYLFDGSGRGWIFNLGTVWMAVLLALTGIIHSYPLLVVVAALAGLGTAAFHPQASTLVSNAAGNRKAVVLSAFIACGNLGFALSPLLLIPLFQTYGLHATVFTVVPGALVALLLLFFTPRSPAAAAARPTIAQMAASLKSAASELSVLVGVIALRSLAYTGMLAILPLYFRSRNLSNIASSHLLTIMLLSGAIGGIIGGLISDHYGRKRLIAGSLILATPLFFGFLVTQGALSMVLLGLAGATLMSNFSVTVVAAQEAIPDNKALAAGISMGFAGGLGALLVIPVGSIGDAAGIGAAMALLFALPLAAGLLALFLKSRPSARAQRLETATGQAYVR
ncbi:MAG TPA: MFS transporter [Spirochaetia bacterium]|nr:MFS transporter [Spirochaetia bacterium]